MSNCSLTCNWGRRFDDKQIEKAVRERQLLTLEIELDESRALHSLNKQDDSKSKSSPDRLSLEEWRNVVDQGLKLGVKRVILKGRGEPLKNNLTLKLMQTIRSLSCDVDLFTSGHLVSRSMAHKLYDMGIHVVVKLDGVDPNLLSLIERRDHRVDGPAAGLVNLIETGYPGNGRLLGIELVIKKQNLDSIADIWRWARMKSIYPFVRRPTFMYRRNENINSEVSLKEIYNLFGMLSQMDREDFQMLWTPHPPSAGLECDCLQYSLSVTATGLVRPCMEMDLQIGDIRLTALETMIRKSTELNQLRRIGSHIRGYCSICRQAKDCNGCRAASLSYSGDPLESDPYCWNRRLIDEDFKKANVCDELPHKDRMRLLNGTAFMDKEKIKIPATIPTASVFLSPRGVFAPLALVEMLAQLCSVQQAFDKNSGQHQNVGGYLVGMDNVSFSETVFAGDDLDLTAWKTFEMEDIHKVQGEIFRGMTEIGKAELTLFETEEWQAMPELTEPAVKASGVIADNLCPWKENKDRVGREILQSVWRLKGRASESVEATLSFAPDFVCFSGHFPEYPVLPAMVMVYAGWLLAEIAHGSELALARVKKGKFLKPVHPYDLLDFDLSLKKKKGDDLIWYNVQINCQNEVAAKYEIGFSLNGKTI